MYCLKLLCFRLRKNRVGKIENLQRIFLRNLLQLSILTRPKPHKKKGLGNNATLVGIEKHELGIPRVIFEEFDAKGSTRNTSCSIE